MKGLDAERLLGGYAAGILTDPEKRTLFRAALEHQELFDALADEEALRELLADPGTRQRLLAVLARPRPLWRRPAVLGLAASLFLLVTTSLVLLRHPAPPVLLSSVQQSDQEAPKTKDAPQANLATPIPAEPAQARPAQARPAQARRTETVAPVREPEASLDLAEPETAPARGLAAGLSAPAAAKSARAVTAKAEEAAVLDASPGTAEVKQAQAGNLAKKERSLTSVLERLEGRRYRLTVRWEAAGHLYVLQRTPAGTVPLKVREAAAGKAATFELTLGDQDVLDIYLLRLPQENPASLPASREVPGEWLRVAPQ